MPSLRCVAAYRILVVATLTAVQMVIRTDWFRLLVLFAEGGLYSDLDTKCPSRVGHELDWTEALAQVLSRSTRGRSTAG